MIESNRRAIVTVSHNEVPYNTVTKLLYLRYNNLANTYEVQAKGRSFAHEQHTWEPLQNVHEDVPEMLQRFLNLYSNKVMAEEARNSSSRIHKEGV